MADVDRRPGAPDDEGSSDELALRRSDPRALQAALALGIVTTVCAGWKAATWPAAVGFDGWAYTMWGQSLAHGESLAYKAHTIPKPLAITLSTATSWLPDGWSAIVIMAAAIGTLAGTLFWLGTVLRGVVAGGIAAIALLVSTSPDSLFEISDGVTAACIVLGLALRGRARLIVFILAGLMRPEAWPLAMFAAFRETNDRSPRFRVMASVAAGLAPAIIWILFDLVLAGDPFASAHWLQDARIERAAGGPAPLVPKPFASVVGTSGSILFEDPVSGAVAAVGVIGLILLTLGYPKGRRSVYPAAVMIVGLVTLLVFFAVVSELYERYLLPFVLTMLALGAGCAIGSFVRTRLHVWWVALACALLIVFGTSRLDVDPLRERARIVTEKVRDSLPAIRVVRDCGRVAFSGNWRARQYIPFVAGISRLSARGFVVNNAPEGESLQPELGVGAIVKLHRGVGGRLPDWPTYETPLGRLAVRPSCEVAGDLGSPVG